MSQKKRYVSQVIDHEKPWSLTHDVPGISKIHKMSCTKDGNLKLYKNKSELDSLEDTYISVSYNSIYHDDATSSSDIHIHVPYVNLQSIKVGDWLVVCYDGKEYPGEVMNKVNNN